MLICCASAPAARAADLAASMAREGARVAAEQTAERAASHPFRKAEMWGGAALMAGGLFAAFYGFGHPTGPVNADVVLARPGDFPHDRRLGFTGVGLAAAGALLAWDGFVHGTSVRADAHEVRVERRFSF